jgi:hypothetical protein
MVCGFGLNMLVGAGAFAIVTFAMFGSAMIPRFVSKLSILLPSRRAHRHLKRRNLAMREISTGPHTATAGFQAQLSPVP